MINLNDEISVFLSGKLFDRARNLFDLCSDCFAAYEQSVYLDVGTEVGYNASVFGANFSQVVAVDLRIPADNILRRSSAHLLAGDGEMLPIQSGTCDLISLISVIEHVKNPDLLLKELWRVLKTDGTLIIQVPNRFFPVDLHSGLPLISYVPTKIGKLLLQKTPYDRLRFISVPTLKGLFRMVYFIDPQAKISVRKVKYSGALIVPRLKGLYNFFSKIGVLDLVPLGYILILRKK
jgi:SAM-dependent methyltransferase